MEEFGMDAQTGFRPERGTIYSFFFFCKTSRTQGTWARETLFIDSVKAFETVPREALFAILRRFGLPDNCVNI